MKNSDTYTLGNIEIITVGILLFGNKRFMKKEYLGLLILNVLLCYSFSVELIILPITIVSRYVYLAMEYLDNLTKNCQVR